MPFIDRSSCLSCKSVVTAKSAIVCDKCRFFTHISCSGLSNEEVKKINNRDGVSIYICPSCYDLNNGNQDLALLLADLKKDLVKFIKEEIKKESEHEPDNFAPQNVDKLYMELDDRARRQNTLILYNIDENAANTDREASQLDDTKVLETLTAIDNTCNFDGIKASRLGKKTTGKMRPIKVTLSCPDTVKRLIVKSFRNRSIGSIKVSADRTPMQRQRIKDLNNEVRVRNANGENVKLFYKNSVPCIVNNNLPKNDQQTPQQHRA